MINQVFYYGGRKMQDFSNLSNGKTDGLVLFYVKDQISYPVYLTQDQAEMLDMMFGMAFSGKYVVDFKNPLGKVKSYCRTK
jgi:hypothetical protein